MTMLKLGPVMTDEHGQEYSKCPHCKRDIGHLNYEFACVETGMADFKGFFIEVEDTTPTGPRTHYRCPECDEEIIPQETL